jgi:transposase
MLSFTGSLKVFLAAQPADLRKSFSGLYAITQQVLREDPESGALFVFTNRTHTRIKSLYWDGTGLWVMTKRLEKGRFSWPKVAGGKVELRPGELALLLDGIELKNATRKAWFRR